MKFLTSFVYEHNMSYSPKENGVQLMFDAVHVDEAASKAKDWYTKNSDEPNPKKIVLASTELEFFGATYDFETLEMAFTNDQI